MLDVIERNSTRLRGLIEDLLVLNRIESGGLHVERQDVHLGELVQHTAEELCPLAAAGPASSVEVHDRCGGVVVSGRPGPTCNRAIVNVMSNAIKFTPAGGRLELSMEVLRVGGIAWAPGDPRVRLCCRDSGIGIPAVGHAAALLAVPPGRERRPSAAIPGTGVGLAIVQDDRGGPRRGAWASRRWRGRAPSS